MQRIITETALAFSKSVPGRVLGALWNAPNEMIGTAYGYLGHALGTIRQGLDPKKQGRPEIRRSRNRTEFINNPLAAAGAITIGSNVVYGDDPYSPKGRETWAVAEAAEGHPVWEHEVQHIVQARQLGPFYLPSNLAGGIAALLFDRDERGRPDWHGDHNWNERGPRSNPPRPWARKVAR